MYLYPDPETKSVFSPQMGTKGFFWLVQVGWKSRLRVCVCVGGGSHTPLPHMGGGSHSLDGGLITLFYCTFWQNQIRSSHKEGWKVWDRRGGEDRRFLWEASVQLSDKLQLPPNQTRMFKSWLENKHTAIRFGTNWIGVHFPIICLLYWNSFGFNCADPWVATFQIGLNVPTMVDETVKYNLFSLCKVWILCEIG